MELLFLSTTRNNYNRGVRNLLKSWLSDGCSVGYIPSCPDPQRRYLAEVEAWLNGLADLVEVDYLNIHGMREWDQASLVKHNCLFVSGGHTYCMLKSLRQSGMDEALRLAVGEGTPIVGVSAGGMVLTPDISNAKAPNDVGLTDTRGLGIVDFLFFPHFEAGEAGVVEVRRHLRTTGYSTAYALPEASGLHVTEDGAKLMGSGFRITP